MKFPLASWGVFLLGAAAALGREAANPDGADGIWDDSYVKAEDSQAEENLAAGKPAFSRPLLRKRHLIKTGEVGRGLKSGVSESNQGGPLSRGFFVVANKQAHHDDHQPSTGHPPFEESRTKFQGSARAGRKSPDISSSKISGITAANAIGGSGGSGRSSSTTTSTSTPTTTTSCASPPCEQLTDKVPPGDNSKHDLPYSSSNNSSSSSSSSCKVIATSGEATRMAARKAAMERPLATKLTTDYRIMQPTLHVLNTINDNQLQKKTAISNLLRGSAFDRVPMRPSMVCPRDPWMRKPTCSLQVGETLTGTVRQAEGGSALWPGTGGSLRPRPLNPAISPTEDGGEETPGSEAMRFATLLGSSRNKALKALDARENYRKEEGGKDAGTGSTKGTVGGWLPWAQRAKNRPFDRVDASGKPKVAAGVLSVWVRGGKRNGLGDDTVPPPTSNKAATADVTTPSTKSGRSGWDWFSPLPSVRPHDEANKTQVAEAGMEVRRGRRTVWGVNADERES